MRCLSRLGGVELIPRDVQLGVLQLDVVAMFVSQTNKRKEMMLVSAIIKKRRKRGCPGFRLNSGKKHERSESTVKDSW